MPESESSETIPAIDDTLRRLEGRINSINKNLHDGLFGESADAKEDQDTIVMPTASLSSIARRIKDIHDIIGTTENYVINIHKSDSPVVV